MKNSQQSASTVNSTLSGAASGGAVGGPYGAAIGAGVGLIGGLMQQRADALAKKKEMELRGAENKAQLQMQLGQSQQQGLESIVAALRSSFIF